LIIDSAALNDKKKNYAFLRFRKKTKATAIDRITIPAIISARSVVEREEFSGCGEAVTVGFGVVIGVGVGLGEAVAVGATVGVMVGEVVIVGEGVTVALGTGVGVGVAGVGVGVGVTVGVGTGVGVTVGMGDARSAILSTYNSAGAGLENANSNAKMSVVLTGPEVKAVEKSRVNCFQPTKLSLIISR
jgi:hypothetical protein